MVTQNKFYFEKIEDARQPLREPRRASEHWSWNKKRSRTDRVLLKIVARQPELALA